MNFPLNQISNLTALVVGDVMVDAYLWGDVNRQSPEAPVPVLLKSGKDSRIGGAGNVARNILAMGAKAHLATVIGNDISGKYLAQMIEEKGIGTGAVITEHNRTTTVKTRIIKGTEHMLRIDEETTDPISEVSKNQLEDEITTLLDSQQVDVIIIEDYDKGVMSEEFARFLIEQATERSIPITVDPKLENFCVYKGVDLFKPNLKELREGLGLSINTNDNESLKNAVERLHKEIEPQMSLTTLGGEGMWMHSSDLMYHHQCSVKRDVVDVSGAGDTVIAVASLMLAVGAKPIEIAKAANIAGGQVCEQSGVGMADPQSILKEFEA